jgi:CheY-like chemotaxis protein
MAEIFGRYIASAMHTLDLLVVERFTTNEAVSKNILAELEDPLKVISKLTNKLLKSGVDDTTSIKLVEAVETIEQRLRASTAGPQTILDADRAGFIKADPTLEGKTVLVADDEDAVRFGVRDVMEKLGFEVTICVDGTKTLEVLKNAKEKNTKFDLIISDIRMPGLNGYEVFRAATEFWPKQIVILMTGFGYDPHHSVMRASQEGMHTVLFKPFRTDQLIEIVQKACRKKVGN